MNKQTKNILTIGFVIVLLIIVSAITYNNNLSNKNKIINKNINTNMYDQNINNQEEQTVFRTALYIRLWGMWFLSFLKTSQ